MFDLHALRYWTYSARIHRYTTLGFDAAGKFLRETWPRPAPRRRSYGLMEICGFMRIYLERIRAELLEVSALVQIQNRCR